MCDEDDNHWDFSVWYMTNVFLVKIYCILIHSFDHPNNKEINKSIVQNVQAVAHEEMIDVALIKRVWD